MYLDFQQNCAVPSFTAAHHQHMWTDGQTDRQAESEANRHTQQLIVNVPNT